MKDTVSNGYQQSHFQILFLSQWKGKTRQFIILNLISKLKNKTNTHESRDNASIFQ